MKYVKLVWSIFIALCLTVILGSVALDRLLPDPTYEVVQTTENLPPLNLRDIERNAPGKQSSLIRLHETNKKEKDRFFCSGFVVSDIYAITAAHCLVDELGKRKLNAIIVHSLDPKYKGTADAKAVALNHSSDLGLIKGDFKKFNKVAVSPKPEDAFKSAGPFVSCGFPYGDTYLCVPFVFKTSSFNMFYGQGFLYPGMSGGPVITEIEGSVQAIGVNSAMVSNGIIIAPLIGLFNDAKVKVK